MRARPAAALILLVSLSTALLGCQESGFDESKETARPLKVQHALGETKVPGQSQDPLTLTVDTLDDTLALDVHPARAAVPGAALPPYLHSAGRGVSVMRPVTASDLSAVEAIHPDLILGSADRQAKLYADLSRIAPTVMTDGGGGQWKLNLRLVGEALGRTNDAEGLLTDYDREAAQTRAAIRHAHPQDREQPKRRVAVALQTQTACASPRVIPSRGRSWPTRECARPARSAERTRSCSPAARARAATSTAASPAWTQRSGSATAARSRARPRWPTCSERSAADGRPARRGLPRPPGARGRPSGWVAFCGHIKG